jgi:Icc-related predicted phosphoesterase
MRAQILSDLHLGVYRIKPITIMDGVDVVIVAGDTCEGVLKAFEHLRRIVPSHIPIIMVMGNHEYYHRFVPDELTLARSQASAFNIHLLEDDTVVLGVRFPGEVRFIGASLWTDYAIFGDANQAAVMNACANGMNDHRLIGWQKEPWLRFRPQEAALLHHRSRAYLADTLAVPFNNGPTVVVTHHAPHWNSVHPRFRSDPVTGAFVSNLEDLILAAQPALWVHGHVHNSADYRVGATRILCNPHGYGAENLDFNGALVVELGP